MLHQKQRQTLERETPDGQTVRAVVAEPRDIALANRLVHELMGRSISELPAQTGKLLHEIDAWVDELARTQNRARGEIRFTRRQVREHTHWGNTQLQMHLRRLEEMEYLIVHRAAHRILYELAYERRSEGGRRHLAGLVDAARLKNPAKLPTVSNRSPLGRGQVAPKSPPGRPGKTEPKAVAPND